MYGLEEIKKMNEDAARGISNFEKLDNAKKAVKARLIVDGPEAIQKEIHHLWMGIMIRKEVLADAGIKAALLDQVGITGEDIRHTAFD